MAIHALGCRMRAVQSESGLIMLEEALFEVALIVTAQTLATLKARTEVGFVLIFVTSQTLLSLEPRPAVFDIVLAFRHVTFLTALLGMDTNQGITGLARVIEFFNVLPSFRYVAGSAVFAFELRRLEKVDIVFCMTAQTGAALFAKELSIIFSGNLFTAFFCVAARTLSPHVRAVEYKSRPRVIEGFLVERIDDRVTAFVFLVTVDTSFAVHQAVKMLFRIDMTRNIFVTIHTFIIGNAATDLMALKTVFVLKILVTKHQWSRSQKFIEQTFKFFCFGFITLCVE